MEKIKNILNPGRSTDDEVLVAPGQSAAPISSGTTSGPTGQGSHFADARNTTIGTSQGMLAQNISGNQASTGIRHEQGPVSGYGQQTTGPMNETGPAAGFSNTTNTGITSGTTGQQPHSSNLLNKLDPRVDSAAAQSSDYRNTAMETGQGVPAQNTSGYSQAPTVIRHEQGPATNVGQQTTNAGVDSGATGQQPHSSNILNKLDPRVDSATAGDPNVQQRSNHHYGRDAAAVGAAGVVGEGIHHHHEKERDNLASSGQGYSGTTPLGAGASYHGGPSGVAVGGPQVSGIDQPEQPHTIAQGHHSLRDAAVEQQAAGPATTGSSGHHYARDAVVGAGGVGLAEHEHRKYQNEHLGQSSVAQPGQPGNHLLRDAGAGAGGVGVAEGVHKHDKDLTTTEREQKREYKQELKEEKADRHKGGLLSFLHRDKNKKYTPEEEAEFDRQEREHQSHKGRDALGGAAIGGVAYEAEKHHHAKEHANQPGYSTANPLVDKSLPSAPGNNGIGTGAGPQNALAGEGQDGKSHHYGRDAALVGGAGAAGAIGHHEYEKHEKRAGGVPLHEKPLGTDLGDKLHGVERNRGVNASNQAAAGGMPVQTGNPGVVNNSSNQAAGSMPVQTTNPGGVNY